MTVVKTIDSVMELDDILNGRVLGAPLKQKVLGLNGLTLIIHDGTANRTVTFVDVDNLGLSPKQILDQIHAANSNELDVGTGLRNYLHNSPPTSPAPQVIITADTWIVRDTGTANTILGFNVNPAGDQTVAAIAAANIISVLTGPAHGWMFTIVHV